MDRTWAAGSYGAGRLSFLAGGIVLTNVQNRVALHWAAEGLAQLDPARVSRLPAITKQSLPGPVPGFDVWDAWPLSDTSGQPVDWRGGQLWFALACEQLDDPEARHFKARIHLLHRQAGDIFVPLGPVFSEGFSPGFAEWSGMARVEDGRAALYFTASGTKGDAQPSYRQRLFVARADMLVGDGSPFGPWSAPVELLPSGSGPYQAPSGQEGRPGAVKGFRDPFVRDADDGRRYLLFTASCARNPGPHDGVIGLAVSDGDDVFRPLDPLVDATGVNNELERPHIIDHDGRLYLFWSTQARVFAPGIVAPTGLYGAVADNMDGPWHLLNGHGLVLANPAREPFQCYSWWVMPDLSVTGFVDYWGVDDPHAAEKPAGRTHFGGRFAPFVRLCLNGDRAGIAGTGD